MDNDTYRILICPKPPYAHYVEGFRIMSCCSCTFPVVVSPSSQWVLDQGIPIYCEQCAEVLMAEAKANGDEVMRLSAKYGPQT